jgi:hypothetical protein
MSKVFFASAGIPTAYSAIPVWRRLAAADERGNHQVVDELGDADVVLFTECHLLGADWRLDTIRATAVAREFRDKVYVYDQRDRPWCAFPGVYVSMPARFLDRRYQAPWSYVPVVDPYLALHLDRPPEVTPDLLVSFIGSRTHPVRADLFALRHPRGLFEAVDGFMFHDPGSRDFADRRRRFAETLYRSKFVLCPRGHGTSSIRLFETLAAGRVPVIISDEWVPPNGPSWESISVRWREDESADRLLAHLEALEPRAAEMGASARDAFTEWFANPVLFDRVASELARLAARNASVGFPRRGERGRAYRRMLIAESAGRVRYRLKHRSTGG